MEAFEYAIRKDVRNNPIVRDMVLNALRYWASEYHIDGFRFDLASILGRDAWGFPLANPPLLETLAYDPILGKCKLIAEAWDAGGLYQGRPHRVGDEQRDERGRTSRRCGPRPWARPRISA